jgi:hypothetical protein
MRNAAVLELLVEILFSAVSRKEVHEHQGAHMKHRVLTRQSGLIIPAIS